MITFALAVVLHCSPALPESWSQSLGAYTVEVDHRAAKITLRDGAGVKWSQPHPFVYRGEVLVAADGTMVITHPGEGKVEVIAPNGHVRGTADVAKAFTEEELDYLPFSTCGRTYFVAPSVEGQQVKLIIPVGRYQRPTERASPPLTFTVDLASLKVQRPAQIAVDPLEAMIELWKTAAAPDRQALTYRLLQRAAHKDAKGNAALCAFCRESVEGKYGPEQQPFGADCLAGAGTDADLDWLASRPASGADQQVLQALERRQSNKRFGYAATVLEQRRDPVLLRQRAVHVACSRVAPDSFKQARLAAADPSPKVRAELSAELREWGPGEIGFELLSQLAADPDAEVRNKARGDLLETYLSGRSRDFEHAFVEQVTHGKLSGWGGGWIAVAGTEEAHNKPAKAEYQKGLDLIGADRPARGSAELALWAEAKLRLAQLALDAKDKTRAIALAEEVAAAEIYGDVRAPQPNQFSGASNNTTVRSASSVAKTIIEAARGKKAR